MNQSSREYLKTKRNKINKALDSVSDFSASVPPRLREAVRYSLLQSGKRLRPILVLTSAELCGGESDIAVPAACALEMIHTYSLIHDDLPAMDNDDLRRGKPTSHKKFGEATAVLAGDTLLTFAFETILKTENPALRAPLAGLLAEAAGPLGMIGGQTDDVIGEKKLSGGSPELNSETLLRSIHRRKTGALLTAAFLLGGTAAGADSIQLEALRQCGSSFGLAFQITDDLLDVTGDEALMGKRLRKDAELGKLTFPGILGIDASRETAADEVDKACRALDVFPDSEPKTAILELTQSLLTREV